MLPIKPLKLLLRERFGFGISFNFEGNDSRRWQRFDFNWTSLKPISVEDLQSVDFTSEGVERNWIFHTDLPSDFGLDSLLALRSEKMQFSKGLFWESAKSNALTSSYLATLLGIPAVLDYFYFYGYSCRIQECLMDSYSRQFNVSRWVFPADLTTLPTSDQRKICYKKTLEKTETQHFQIQKGPEFVFQNHPWNTYQLVPRALSFQNATVEVVNPSELSPLEDNLVEEFHSQSIKKTFTACSKGLESQGRVDIGPASYIHLSKIWPDVMDRADSPSLIEAKFYRMQSGSDEIEVPSDRDELLWVKLNPVPGLRVFDSSGQDLSVEPAYPGFLTVGRGKMRIEYSRPLIFWFSYILSLVTLCVLGGVNFRSRTRGQEKQSGFRSVF